MRNKLTPLQQHVWTLTWHGFTEEQIATEVGLDLGNVRKALGEANRKARRANGQS